MSVKVNKTRRKEKSATKEVRKSFKKQKVSVGDVYKTKDKYLYEVKETNPRRKKKKEERNRPVTVTGKKGDQITIARITTKPKGKNINAPNTISFNNKKTKLNKKSYVKVETIDTTTDKKRIKEKNFNPKETNTKKINDSNKFIDYSGKVDKRVIKRIKK